MLAIKLKLIGKKGQHSFRVIVQEKRAKLDGKFVDDLGWYNPHSNQVKVNQEKLRHWLENGAQPTESAEKAIQKAKDSSEVQSYEGRKNPKKKKKTKVAQEGDSPDASAKSPEAIARSDEVGSREEASREKQPASPEMSQGGPKEAPASAEATAGEPAEGESPAEEAAEVPPGEKQEESKETKEEAPVEEQPVEETKKEEKQEEKTP